MARIAPEAGFTTISFRKRTKPVHWTLSLQNWAVGTGKRGAITRFFDLRNPLLLIPFGVVNAVQLALFDRASDIQYVAVNDPAIPYPRPAASRPALMVPG
jgi:hypothetical protein